MYERHVPFSPAIMSSSRAVRALFRHRPQRRLFSATSRSDADFTHAVIGGGAVGLAIARRLQQVEGAQVVLIEKHGMVGSETSSRNSEVRFITYDTAKQNKLAVIHT